MENKKNALGIKIKELRDAKDMSQEQLSKKAKVARTVITMIETGQRYPTEKTLNKIVDALEATKEEFNTPEIQEQATQQFKEVANNFINKASTDDIIKMCRKMVK